MSASKPVTTVWQREHEGRTNGETCYRQKPLLVLLIHPARNPRCEVSPWRAVVARSKFVASSHTCELYNLFNWSTTLREKYSPTICSDLASENRACEPSLRSHTSAVCAQCTVKCCARRHGRWRFSHRYDTGRLTHWSHMDFRL